MPTSWLQAINDAGAYYYACYLSINLGLILSLKFLINYNKSRLHSRLRPLWRPRPTQSSRAPFFTARRPASIKSGQRGRMATQGPAEALDEAGRQGRG